MRDLVIAGGIEGGLVVGVTWFVAHITKLFPPKITNDNGPTDDKRG